MATRYFQSDNRYLSFRECWNFAPGLIAKIVLIGAKVLRIRFKIAGAVPLPDSVRDSQISEAELTPEVRHELNQVLAELQPLGFHSPQYTTPKESLTPGIHIVIANLLHVSGEMIAQISYAKNLLLQPATATIHSNFDTVLADGTVLGTGNNPRQMDPVAGDHIVYLPGRSVTTLYQAHVRRLEKRRATLRIRSIRLVEDLWAYNEEEMRRAIDERTARKVWAFVPPEQVEALRATQKEPPLLPDTEVYTELEKLQEPSKGWSRTALILILSAILFVLAGSWQWQWQTALMLVPILFFHELGHFVAMRLFGYQNLRMFFVPFFGAAVAGLRLNAPAWQQVVVALAGPIPGIVVGGAMQIAGSAYDIHWLEKFGRWCVIINGFNLLPLLPLDGGRVLDALFYVRNRWLEVVATVLTIGCLMFLGLTGLGKVLFFIGLAMLIGLPHLWRIARITTKVRAKGFRPDDESIPRISREAADAILVEARRTLPPLPPKSIAQIVLAVYQRLHTRAAGIPATFGLLALYVGGFFLAIAVALQTFLGLFPDPPQSRLNPLDPKFAYTCNDGAQPGGADFESFSNRFTVIASFSTATLASAAFDRFQTNSEAAARSILFGQSVFVSAENPATNWPESVSRHLKAPGAQMLAERTNSVGVILRAMAPTEDLAEGLEEELAVYFRVSARFHILPPWSDLSQISEEELARQKRARHTYRELLNTGAHLFADPQAKTYTALLQKAIVSEDKAAIEAAIKQQTDFTQKRIRGLQEALLKSTDPLIDHPTITAYLRQPTEGSNPEVCREWDREMEQCLGTSASGASLGAHGTVQRRKRELTFYYLSFDRTARGLPALAKYLCDHGCTAIRYGLVSGESGDEKEE